MVHEYRGSEWRRWELHLHTPYTRKEDQFAGSAPDERWDSFYSTIDEYIGDGSNPSKAISVIAITDYLSIENYNKVAADDRLPDCVKMVLPNVELRITPIAKSAPINIHCIFSPAIVHRLENLFFTRLKIVCDANTYTAIQSDLILFGRAHEHNKHLSEDQAYNVGLTNFVVPFENFKKVFDNNKDLRDNTIIAVADGTGDGVSGLKDHKGYTEESKSQLEATRRELYRFADMIFTATPGSIKYFSGCGSDSADEVIAKIGSLKPCIHGSDAHTNEDIFEPDLKRYCWIKADPTFEGLKQLLYEPKDRVYIGPLCPDPKQAYHVIDKVIIKGNKNFSEEPMYLNDKLNCIIGGKSTGKSLLLHNIALAIDADQVEKKTEKATTNVKPIPQLKVYWKDGTCSDDSSNSRKIVYIPQTYLNRLSDEEETTTEIDTIVQGIIMQKEEVASLFEEKAEECKRIRQNVISAITELLQCYENGQQTTEMIKEIGDSKGINTELDGLKQRLEELSSSDSITENDLRDYQNYIESQQAYQGILATLQHDREIIEDIDTVVQGIRYHVLDNAELAEQFSQSVKHVLKVAKAEWSNQKVALLEAITKKHEETTKLLNKCIENIKALKPKIESNNEINDISKRILSERTKLVKIDNLTKKVIEFNGSLTSKRSFLANTFCDYQQIYSDFVEEVNKLVETLEEDLTFQVVSIFRRAHFSEKVLELFDNRMIGRFTAFSLAEINEQDFLNQANVEKLIHAIVNGSLPIKAGKTSESVLRELFCDWYNIHYDVKIDNDGIEDMSPGNKALVLLKLLVSLAESRCPILIDQPEDDLDNRSIYDELIQFIKTKKKHRQIIVVTHNANIVLGADAELVIVANQHGNSTPNKSFRFEYRGGAIENNEPVLDTSDGMIKGVLNRKGIPSHICEILEGGEQAFDLRRSKYRSIIPEW